MKKKNLKNFTFIFLIAILSSCNGNKNTDSLSSTNNESQIPSNSSEDTMNRDIIENEQYMWPFQEDNAFKGTMFFTVGSQLEDRNLSLKIENNLIEKEKKVNYDARIIYDLSSVYPCHSDTIEHAYNAITFNDVSMGALPSDDTKGIDIPNANIDDGMNVFSLTIGQVYANNKSYDKNSVHGGLNGGGDDFQIANVAMQYPTGEIIKPSKLVIYKPKAIDSKEYVTYEIQQVDDQFYWIGDGWGGSLSVDKSSNPRLDIPFRIDYYFECYTPGSLSTYQIDTTQYKEGKYTVSLYDDTQVVLQNNVYFDNNGPEVMTNMTDYQLTNNHFVIESDIFDKASGVSSQSIRIDGQVMDNKIINLSTFNPGQHHLAIYASDYAGNETFYDRNFIILANADTIEIKAEQNDLSIHTSYDSELSLKVFSAEEVNYTSLYPINQKQTSSTSIPYDEFTVEVKDANKDLYLSYQGETMNGERLLIEAFNPTKNAYETITMTNSNRMINFVIHPQNYVSNHSLKLRVTPLYVNNGSNRILWSSDTQYLPKVKFTDINYMYSELMEYIVDEYRNDKMSYLVHTGDIVDNPPSYKESAIAEWEKATVAFEILDNANVPYGVSAGNHDVGTAISAVDYSYFSQYFGVKRYNNHLVYGGALNDNECHYDLITIGQYDFIVLYLGFGVEAKPQTIQWANQVLKTYRHRNAIIATHAYLTAEGELDKNVQAQQIYDEIVVPNDNVSFVFCGHTDGNACVKKQINDNRFVYEILNCYQFVETKSYAVSHIINGYKCNGEAFIKELTFEDNVVKCHTFSPVIHATFPLNSKDDFEIQVDLRDAQRELTSKSLKVYQANENIYSRNQISSSLSLDNLISGQKYIAYVKDNGDGYGFVLIG